VPGDSSRPWWREWAQPSGYVAITGALGLLAFLILNVACAVFYDPLGVDPREVGLGYGEMLVKAATGAAMLFVAVTVLLGVVLLTAVAVLDLLERVTTLDRLRRTEADHRDDVGRSEPDRHEDRSPGDAARDRTEPPLITGWKIVLVPLVALGVTVFLRWAFTAYPRPAGFGVFLLLATLSFIGLIRILSAADPAVAIRRLGGGGNLALGALTAVLVAAGLLMYFADRQSKAVRDGEKASGLMGMPMPRHAEVAQAMWKDDADSRPALPGCGLYLGEANSRVVLIVAEEGHRRAMRLPAADTVIEITRESDHCPLG
jgi:hypothetical protein